MLQQEDTSAFNWMVKLLIVGNSGVGKT